MRSQGSHQRSRSRPHRSTRRASPRRSSTSRLHRSSRPAKPLSECIADQDRRGGTAILLRTGKRRSAIVIISCGLPASRVPYSFYKIITRRFAWCHGRGVRNRIMRPCPAD
jgi:hypothetical protein